MIYNEIKKRDGKIRLQVVEEFGSFDRYIWSFIDGQVLHRDFKFMGTATTFSYLEAIGVMNNHAEDCFCYEGGADCI